MLSLLLALKSPVKSAMLSLALPGGGQFYNGRVLKGSVVALSEGFLMYKIAYHVSRYRTYNSENDYWLSLSYVVGFLWLKLFSTTDAYIDAQFINVQLSKERISINFSITFP